MTNLFKRRYSSADEDYYDKPKQNKNIAKFSVFVVIALLVVTIIIGSIFYFNFKNNSLRTFVKASSNVLDCGSFEYHIAASIDGTPYMDYKGEMSFDHENRYMVSLYHADYNDYEYDAVLLAKSDVAVKGNYYGGKWTVEDYTSSAHDFMDFYNDYRNYNFNAAAAMRFLGDTKTFNSANLETAMDNIFSELSKPNNLKNVLHQHIEEKDGKTIYTFKPEMFELSQIVLEHIAPAYSSAKVYAEFKDTIFKNEDNLRNVDATLMYTIDENEYLTDVLLNYTVNGKTYTIKVELGKFTEPNPHVPEDFLVAANAQR